MAIFRGILGIIIGVGAAYLAGILLDYFNVYKGADYTRVYPFLTSLGGGIAAFVAMLIRGSVGSARVVVERASKVRAKDDALTRLAQSMSGSAASTPAGTPSGSAGDSSASGRVNIGESREVPGMPSFEVKSTPPGESPGGSRPKVQQ